MKRIRDKRQYTHLDVKRKTYTAKVRELNNLQHRKEIEFQGIVGEAARLQRTGNRSKLA